MLVSLAEGGCAYISFTNYLISSHWRDKGKLGGVIMLLLGPARNSSQSPSADLELGEERGT